jgi:O-antigen/teichoic acid export membrane protein|tara:strand:- start:1439 stop:2593 length:1155 start_codon:yes stop_codon:yes gene_type:complete
MKILEKIKTFYQNFKGLTTMGAATLISSGLGGLFWFYMASLMGTEGYGQVSYYIAIAVIGSRISLLGFANTMMVYSAKGVKIQPPIYLIAILGSIITSLILFFVFLYDVGISLYVIGFVTFTLITSDLLGRKQYKSYAKYLISQKIILIILAVILYHTIGLTGVILGIAISFLPYSFVIYKEFKNTKIDFSLIRNRAKFVTNTFANDLSEMFGGYLDKLIVAPMLGFVLLGNYQLGIQFMLVFQIVPVMFYHYLLPKDARDESNTNLRKNIMLFSIILCILAIILSPFVIPVLFPEFTESVPVIQILSIAIIPFTASTILNSKFFGTEKTKFVLIGSIILVSVQIPSIIGLTTLYGINGAAVSILLANTCQAIYLLLSYKIFYK